MSEKKEVYKYDIEGNFLEKYESISEAYKSADCTRTTMIDNIRLKRVFKNHIWSDTPPERFNKSTKERLVKGLSKRGKEVTAELTTIQKSINPNTNE